MLGDRPCVRCCTSA